MIKKEIQKLIAQELKKEDVFEINVECPADPKNGDYSSNIALRMDNPLESAQHLARNIKSGMFSKIEAVKPGFLNFYLSESFLQKKLKEIIKEKDRFGCLPKKNQTINVEFISANPTGPLTLGNGRGGFCGDVLARVLEKAGYIVCREYYINDRGVQIEKLGHSILKDDQAVYKGEYIDQLSKRVKGDYKEAGEKASSIILEEMIKPTVKRMGIDFDVWFSEKTLYQDSSVDRTIKDLEKRGFTYVSEKATWFKSKDLEDDKDRVLIRSDGQKTYFASD
ncbi:arginine--tRNA ligase, partial [Patescibacteria group bacterium]|nr:arginine--tRNA ligase [Patescibacteria group bacterium]